jgi:hypothetical protein
MAREYIYTGPGGPPVNFGTDTPVTQQQVGAVMAADNPLSALASFAASIPDFGIDALKGIVDLSRAQGQLFDRIGRQRPPFAQLAGSGLGKGLQSIPEGVVTEAVQNALTFGNRDKLIETMGGDTAFKAAPVLGTGMAIPLLASGALGTRVMKSFDVASDVLGATPGATQAFQAAKTGPQLLAASGGVGLGSSILPSVHYATDQATGEIDKSILGTGMLTGLGAGLGLPGLLAAPALAKGAAKGMKGALDSIVQGVGQAIKQSDNAKIMKQMSEAAFQRQKMAAMTQKAEAETANFYKPQVEDTGELTVQFGADGKAIKETAGQNRGRGETFKSEAYGDLQEVEYYTTRSGKEQVTTYVVNRETGERSVLDILPIEKAQKKYGTNDKQVIADRLIAGEYHSDHPETGEPIWSLNDSYKRIAPQPQVEKTFSDKVPSYEEQPNITKMQEEDLTRLAAEEVKHAEEFQATSSKLEKELDTTAAYIEEAKAKPIEVTEKEVVDSFTGPKTKREIVDNLRAAKKAEMEATQGKAKAAAKAELDTAMSKQMTLKEKQKNLAKLMKEKTPEELQKEFGKPVDKIQRSLEKEILTNEKGIGKIQKKLESIDKKLEKSVPVKRQEVDAEVARINEEKEALRQKIFKEKETEQQALVQDLEKEAENLFTKYEKEKAGHQKKLEKVQKQKQEVESFAPKPQLPAVIPEAPAAPRPRFISGPQGIKEYDPATGLPVKPKEPISVDNDGNVVINKVVETKTSGEKWVEEFGAPMKMETGKHGAHVTPVRNKFLRINKEMGGKFVRHSQDYRLVKTQQEESLNDLIKVAGKYQNDNTVMALAGEVSSGRASIDLLPADFKAAWTKAQEHFNWMYDFLKSSGYEMPKKLENYLPFRVRDLEALRAADGNAAKTIDEYLSSLNKVETKELNDTERQLLIQRLETGRTQTQYTPDKMPAYKSMPEAIRSYIDETSKAYADAKLFGGKMQRGKGELYADLILGTEGIQPKDAPELLNLIGRYFGDRDFTSGPFYKAYQSTVALWLLTGHKTSLAQLSSVVLNLQKFGLTEALDGTKKAVIVLTGHEPSFARKLGASDMPTDMNDVGIESMGQLIDFVKSQRLTAAEKSGKVAKSASFKLLQFADFFEKESTYQSAYNWLKNNHNKGAFKVFEDRYQGTFTPEEFKQMKIDLKQLKAGKKQGLPDDLVLRAVDSLAGERVVAGSLDKSGGALGGTGERVIHALQTYVYKLAADIHDNTIMLVKESIKEKNPEKAKAAFKYLTGLLMVVGPGLTYWNAIKAGKSMEAAGELATNPGEILKTVMKEANPAGVRALDILSTAGSGDSGTQVGLSLMNTVAPGSSTTMKIAGDTLKTLAQDPVNVFNPNVNPSSKYLPPSAINEAIYNASEAKVEKDSARENNDSNISKLTRIENDLKFLDKHPDFARTIDKTTLSTKRTQRAINEYRDNYQRMKEYGTLDKADAQTH